MRSKLTSTLIVVGLFCAAPALASHIIQCTMGWLWLLFSEERWRQRGQDGPGGLFGCRLCPPSRLASRRGGGDAALARCGRGKPGEVHLLSTNNMIVRRAVFQANPLPEDAGPLAYRVVTERLRRNGGKLYFQPTMLATHDFEGWPMERDLRRQIGWTSIRIRQIDGTLPGAGVIRTLGPASLPLFWAFRWVESTGHCLRLPKYFGLHWRHVPILLGLAALVHSFELPGMLRALRSKSAGPTVYR